MITKCASKRAEVVACTAYSDGSRDETRARDAAAALGVGVVTTRLTPVNVKEAMGTVDLPFEATQMDRSLWCLYYLVARSARGAGVKVMLLGQLADELFGGYAKYARALVVGGADAAQSMMTADLKEYAHRGRLRDFGACRRWVEPRLPFEEGEVVEFASGLPVAFKIRGGVRKAVLRRAAQILDVPEDLAMGAKKAAQYSSGVQKLVAHSAFYFPAMDGPP